MRCCGAPPHPRPMAGWSGSTCRPRQPPSPSWHRPPWPCPDTRKEMCMDDHTLTTPALTPTSITPPRARTRGPARPVRPRAATTVSAAIMRDRGLAAGYVALPLARLMASRVWASVESLNQQLTVLEQYSFTRMTADRTFEAQGQGLQQLLRAYATLTEDVATLAQRLAQNRLTEADRRLLATGHLAQLLPPAPAGPAAPAPDPATAPPPAATPEATTDTRPEVVFDPAAPERSADLPALTPVANGVMSAVP